MSIMEIALGNNPPRSEVIRIAVMLARLKMHEYAKRVAVMLCDHREWSFKTQGRRCFICGAWMVDFGD